MIEDTYLHLVNQWRGHFPILHTSVYDNPLIYLDNASTTQKPQVVIDTLSQFYQNYNANIHRGVYYLSQKSTDLFEHTREIVRSFINAKKQSEIIFTKGATEAINLIASSFGDAFIQKDDEIIISQMEHHANILPWQILCEKKGCILKVIPIDKNGELLIDSLQELISNKTKIISIVYVSNVIGTVNPIAEIISLAKQYNIPIVLDACQAIQHIPIDVQALDCDFMVFSGHKIYGPSGTGVLYGKEELLNQMPPYQGGGDMIHKVTFEKSTYAGLPYKFEAGTPNIEGIIGLGTAISFFSSLSFESIHIYENFLYLYALELLQSIPEITIIGNAKQRISAISFIVDSIHPHDMASLLDRDGIAVRAGHHCAQPLMKFFNVPATTRASFAFYNTREEIDIFIHSVKKAIKLFA
jgi:cysteine desulfurase / selenocysteine lyase